MLKTYPTTFLLPKRLKLASVVSRLDPDSTASQPTSNLSTDASTAASLPPHDNSQPILLAAHKPRVSMSDAAPRPQRSIMPYFPLGYKEAACQWWTSVSSRQAERSVLSYVPYLREATGETVGSQLQEIAKSDPFGQRVWRSSMVQLSGKDRALNELAIERVGEEAGDTLVMLHGYGAGLGFFYKNFEPLSRPKGWRLYALDMLGMGNSARPPFKIHAKDPKEKIAEAESWFIDALEEWRKIRKIEKFTLLGHSLGGYLAVSYALKYPGRLNKLILASPVGIPEDPWAVNAEMPEPEESALANEFIQDQESIVSGQPAGDNAAFVRAGAGNKAAVAAKPNTATAPPKRPIPSWLVWLWDANVSPFSIVRMAGPLGPRFVSGWTSRRFNHLPPEEKEALHTYSYSLFRQKGSGEYALPYLLAPGAYARNPVINRIHEVGRQVIRPATDASPAVRETGLPIVFMYGENDWMDVAGGYAAEEKIKQRIVKALTHGTEEEKRNENGSAKVIVVRKAGHHLYLDNPDEFNLAIRWEMEDTTQRRLRALDV
ncbi:putative cardiolipin-specific deacylase, mitochondrial [Madurella mycetomatis]|uniref:Cardiolipin-specific deacylase, mitochondrial n=1 Tax=Madurella mycetomatis TaxID=100816 RepID=A0A175VTQ4_9PEZI|nr:putative cardiolipin-specific deacylase, mitochondrial [Madurella mycetomatis]